MFESEDEVVKSNEGEVREKVAALEGEGRTTMVVRVGGEFIGVIGLMDRPREGARDAIRRLKQLGSGEAGHDYGG